MKKRFQVEFEDGTTVQFYVNDLTGRYYGELWMQNPKHLGDGEYKIADNVEFSDDTYEGFMQQVKEFIMKNINEVFRITEQH